MDLQAALLATIGLWSFGLGVDALIQLSAGQLPPASHLWDWALHSAISFLVYPAVVKAERLPWWARWPLLFVGVVTVAVVHILFDAWLGNFALIRSARVSQALALLGDLRSLTATPGFVIFLYVSAFNAFAIIFIRAQRRAEAERRRLLAAELTAQKAQLTALRLQINPHFLFNTLNTVSGLMMTGRLAEAELMMARLAEFLRTSLTTDPTLDVTVDDELAAAEAYLQIEAARIGERMRVEIDCEREVRRALVPNLLLQPLVENAVKYGVAPATGSVKLRLAASRDGDDLVLEVIDQADAGTGPAGTPAPGGTGLGLANVRRRLEVLYGDRGRLATSPQPGGWAAAVRLPLRYAAEALPAAA